MSISSQRGRVAIGIQGVEATAGHGKGVPATAFTSYALVAHSINLMQAQETLPPEIGGTALARGSYKTGYLVAGQITVVVRMTDIGKLLYAATGAATVGAVSAATVYPHTFKMSSDNFFLPWLTIRRAVGGDSGSTPGTYKVDEFLDCKVISLRLSLPARGTLTAQIGFIGREATVEDDITIPSPSDASFGLGCTGACSISDLPTVTFMGAELTIVNQTTTPEQEQSIGTYTMDDVTVLSRAAQIRMMTRWNDRELHDLLAYGGGTTWDPAPMSKQLTVTAKSFDAIPGSTGDVPYELTFQTGATNTILNYQPLELQSGQVIMMGIDGNIIQPASGDAFTFTLKNARSTSYATTS
jgi:hypothetical protein